MLSNLIYKFLGWLFLRFVNFVAKSQFLYFWWIFLSFLVKIDIFDFFFRTASRSASKFDIQVPWVVLSQICSFRVNILNFVFLVNILGHFWSKLIFSTSSPEPQLGMVSNLICKYLRWFSLRFVHFVLISWILYFWWIFWVIFGQNWYFRPLLQNRNSDGFQNWYASTLGGSLSDLFISCQYLEFCIFGEYFGSFLVKTDIFDFFFRTATQNGFKFDMQVP